MSEKSCRTCEKAESCQCMKKDRMDFGNMEMMAAERVARREVKEDCAPVETTEDYIPVEMAAEMAVTAPREDGALMRRESEIRRPSGTLTWNTSCE